MVCYVMLFFTSCKTLHLSTKSNHARALPTAAAVGKSIVSGVCYGMLCYVPFTSCNNNTPVNKIMVTRVRYGKLRYA